MKLLLLSQLRFLRRAPWSSLTVFVGVALGVASVVAVHQIGVRVERSLAQGLPPHLQGISHVLDKTDLTMADYFVLRREWRAGMHAEVQNLVPVVEAQLVSQGAAGDGLPAGRILVFATDWLAARPGHRGSSVEVPAGLFARNALLADSTLGLPVGREVLVNGARYRIAAVVQSGLGPAFFADLGTAHRLLALAPDSLTFVGALVADPYAGLRQMLDSLLPGFSAGLPEPGAGWWPAGWTVRSVRAEQPTAQFARAVLFNLGALGSLALVVAWFLIYQVGVIWLRRQRRVMDRLRLMGVTRAELAGGFLLSMGLLGASATVLGLLLGLPLADGLMRLTSGEAGTAAPVAGGFAGGIVQQHWPAYLLVKALGSGLCVALVGGWMAFMREWPVGRRFGTKLPVGPAPGRWAPGRERRRPLLVLLGLGAVLAAGSLWPVTGLLGGFVAVLAACLIVTSSVRPLLELVRRLSRRLPGRLLTRISVRELAWYPGDLSVALGALSLAVATSIGMGLMVESFRQDFQAMLQQRLAGDLFARGPVSAVSGAASWLAGQPGVERVSLYGQARIRVQGLAAQLGYSEFAAADARRYGAAAALQPGQAIVSERLARDLGVRVGSRLAVGGRQLAVVRVFAGFGDAAPRVLVRDDTAAELGVTPLHDQLSLVSARAEQLGAELARRFPELELQSRSALRGLALAVFDRTFAITQALTLLALLVALIGLYNALIAIRLNQQQSARLLASLGVAARDLKRLDLKRALGVGGCAVLLAVPLGGVMAWLLCAVINPRAFGWTIELHPAVWQVLGPVLLGLGAAWLAGALPVPREALLAEDL